MRRYICTYEEHIWFTSIGIDACASFEYTSRGYTSQCREEGTIIVFETGKFLLIPKIFVGINKMQPVVWTLIGLVTYVCGLVLVVTMTPRLWKFSYDEWMFMGYAIAVVSGGILVFVPLGITFALFNGSFGVKIFDFLLLVGIFVVGLRMSLRSFRPRYAGGTFQVSRILAGSFCLLLLAASVYCIFLLFLTPQS